jgi:hypothetical protein
MGGLAQYPFCAVVRQQIKMHCGAVVPSDFLANQGRNGVDETAFPPVAVTTNSPRREKLAPTASVKRKATDLSAAPACRSTKCGVQPLGDAALTEQLLEELPPALATQALAPTTSNRSWQGQRLYAGAISQKPLPKRRRNPAVASFTGASTVTPAATR